ncbi:MAG: C1 family peptidase [Geminicoccaceae bacterium]|nr:C1 family peptidase [Geminicoccaceae bacterium]
MPRERDEEDTETERSRPIADRARGLAEAPAPFALAPVRGSERRTLSPAARQLILRFESGGREYYEKVIKSRPHWPGHASGITIGFGWDLGYHTRAELERLWRPHLGAARTERLAAALGLRAVEPERDEKVRRIRALLRALADIAIPWEVAEAVFDAHVIPGEIARTERALPHTDELPDDCFGALVSLVFNRGAGGFDHPAERFREMRAIKAAMEEGDFARIPDLIRAMKRLWPDSPGLKERREEEARLFERGLGIGEARAPVAAARAAAAIEAPQALPVLDAAPDRIDLRDLPYRAPLVPLPERWPPPELVAEYLPAYCADGMILDQGREGACTGYGLAACINFLYWSRWVAAGRPEHAKPARVSPKMLYELARLYDEWPGEDYEGSSCRGAMKAWHKHGVCAEALWPRDGRPDPRWVEDAAERPLGAYYRIDRSSIADLQAAIREVGAVYVSAMVHRGWRLGPARELPVIPWRGQAPEGGHAFALVGYERRGFIVQNSWGERWGYRGFAILGYDDWLANGMDAWVAVTGAPVVRGAIGSEPSAGLELAPVAIDRPLLVRAALARRAPALDDPRWDEARARRHTLVIGNDGRAERRQPDAFDARDEVDLLVHRLPASGLDALASTKIAIYVHGGLNSENDAIRRAQVLGPLFLRNGIWPIFVAWRSGFGETLSALVEDIGRKVLEGLGLRAGRTPLHRIAAALDEIRDRSIEWLAGIGLPRALWVEMKENGAAATEERGALRLAAEALAQLRRKRPDLELHLVGHSAGSILLGRFLAPLSEHAFDVASLHLFAPACTMGFAAETFAAAAGRRRRKTIDPRRTAIWVLSDDNERRDSVGPYGKSLLYLVSRALERRQRAPLLGLEAAWDPSVAPEREPVDLDDPGRLRWLELWAEGPAPLVVREPCLSDGARPIAATHGAFDNSVEVVGALLRAVLGAEPKVPPNELSGF